MQPAVKGMITASWAVTGSWYIKTRGRVLGIVTIGAPLASAVYTPLIARVVEAGVSFSTAFAATGIVVIIIGILSIFMVRSKPEEVGLTPDGLPAPEGETRMPPKNAEKTKWTFKRVLSCKEFWAISMGFSCLFAIQTGFMSIFVKRMLDLGVSMNFALNAMTGSSLVGILLSYLWGWLDDKRGTNKATFAFSVSILFMSVSMLLAGITNGNMVFIIIAVIGTASSSGGLPNLQPSLMAYVFGRRDMMHISKWYNIIFGILTTPSLLLFNWIRDTTGSYDNVYWICTVLAVIAIVCFALIKKTYDPDRLKIGNAAE